MKKRASSHLERDAGSVYLLQWRGWTFAAQMGRSDTWLCNWVEFLLLLFTAVLLLYKSSVESSLNQNSLSIHHLSNCSRKCCKEFKSKGRDNWRQTRIVWHKQHVPVSRWHDSLLPRRTLRLRQARRLVFIRRGGAGRFFVTVSQYV